MIKFISNGVFRTAGTEKVILQLAKDLPYEVLIIVPESEDIAFSGYDNVKIHSLHIGEFPETGALKKIIHRIKYFFAVKKYIKSGDMVFGFSLDLNILTILLSVFYNIKPFVCEHIEYGYHKGIRNILRKFFYRFKSVKLICLTETDKEKFIKDKINAYCIPNFIYPVNSDYDNNSKTILAIGRLVYQKNFLFLVDAFYLSKLYEKGFKLVIIGEGEDYAEVKQQVEKLSLSDSVSIEKFTKEIDKHYKSARLFCMTSRFEAFPMVLLEAMNFSLPVLLTDFPTGAREILGEDNDQILLGNNEVQDYADKLLHLSTNEEVLDTLSKRNKETVSKYYLSNVIDNWIRVIEE